MSQTDPTAPTFHDDRQRLERALSTSAVEEWHALAWRPAGSMSLSERWLRAGAPFPLSAAPPRARSKRRGR